MTTDASTDKTALSRVRRVALRWIALVVLVSVATAFAMPALRSGDEITGDHRVADLPITEISEITEISLKLTGDPTDTELLDTQTGRITSLADVVSGDRAVLLWYWAADCDAAREQALEVERFARRHQDTLQVIGIGSQGDFDSAQRFVTEAGLETTTMLWEGSGNLARLNRARSNSSIQLHAYDLTLRSSVLPFDDRGRQIVLDAAPQQPYAPPVTSTPGQEGLGPRSAN